MRHSEPLVFDPEIIRRFDVNGPRYTSYPTADRFVAGFDARLVRDWLGQRTLLAPKSPLAIPTDLDCPGCSKD